MDFVYQPSSQKQCLIGFPIHHVYFMLYRPYYCLLLEYLPYLSASSSSVLLASCIYTTELFF